MTTELSAGRESTVASSTDAAAALAEILAGLLQRESVAPDEHFFDDLGADSLLMAHFCARVRKRSDLPSLSMREVYRHPTIAALAAQLEPGDRGTVVGSKPPGPTTVPRPPKGAVVRCGALQAAALIAYATIAGVVAVQGVSWIAAGAGVVDVYLRSVLVGGGIFVGLSLLPIVVKWLLVGRWQRQEIRLWSLSYVRFWCVATLVRTSPMVAFAGTPLYLLYLRALGARIGQGAAIFSRVVPVCADLLTVGPGAVIRQDVLLNCYRAHGGMIQTGTVTLGRDAVVGEASVLDIDTALGDRAQLAHASSLHAGQSIADDARCHGSPAQPTEVDHRLVPPAPCGVGRKIAYSVAQLAKLLLVQLPFAIAGFVLLLTELPWLAGLVVPGSAALGKGSFYVDALVASIALFVGVAVAGLLVIAVVPRVLNLGLRPDRVYPLYGIRYGLHRAIERLTNVRFFTTLFGDSAAIVHYLRGIGYRLTPVEQTGSNFGLDVRHENPYLSSVGTGTMVADGLALLNADFSNTSFRLSQTSIGPRNFVGNNVAYPSQGRTGDDCLLATKVMVPIDGARREGVGLLGSPAFEIPRSVQRDGRFDHLRVGPEFRRRLAAKTRHNAVTMALYLLVGWVRLFVAMLLGLIALNFYDTLGSVAVTLAGIAILVSGVGLSVLVERAATGFRSLRPEYCSIYQPYFWWHERYWKLSAEPRFLNGTPFKSLAWRLLGVRIGARVFDDGCSVVEKTLVTIGDDSVLNARSTIQGHSQEDGAFKSDRVTIGSGCTVGVGALVHYGVSMGDGAILAPDSFLMKGEDVPAYAQWGGNPARESARREDGR